MTARDDPTNPESDSAQAEVATLRAALETAHRALAERDEAIQARDDFLSIAAHELRNPLHTLTLQLTLLQRLAERSDEPAIGQQAERAIRSAGLFSRRASVLLDVGRLQRGLFHLDLGPVDVAALAADVVDRLREDAAFHRVTVTVSVDVPAVCRWDRQAVDQALSNLVGNAIKYGEGRPVRVRARLCADGAAVRLVVRDEGPGISPADRGRVFERFERLLRDRPRAEGFGLGLWLTRRIVIAHRGTIRIESSPGRGSSFILHLPVDPAVSVPPPLTTRDHDDLD